MVRYSKANAKIQNLSKVPALANYLRNGRKVYSLDLLSGWSCPYAKDCLSKVHVIDGKRKVIDGPDTKFRCFSASQEALFPPVYEMRKANFEALRSAKGIDGKYNLLNDNLPKNAGIIRIHVAGDMFNQDYFDAWVRMAETHPNVLFYAYTKSLPFWLAYEWLPYNLVLTASRGGRRDDMIDQYNLREAIVVFTEETAWNADLDIDSDDSHAANPETYDVSFALLIHGIQPKGSNAGKAVKALKGKGSYNRKKK